MKRVLLNSEKVSVSLPGYDVEEALLDELAFDARFSSIRSVQRGFVRMQGRVFNTGDFLHYPNTTGVSFSPAFPQPPVVMFGVEQYSGGLRYLHPHVSFGAYGWHSFPYDALFQNVTFFVSASGISITCNILADYGTGWEIYDEGPFRNIMRSYHNIHWIAWV